MSPILFPIMVSLHWMHSSASKSILGNTVSPLLCFTRKKIFVERNTLLLVGNVLGPISRESCFSGCKFGWLVGWFLSSKSRHLRKRVTHSYIHRARPLFQYQFLVAVFSCVPTHSNWVTGHEFRRKKSLNLSGKKLCKIL